MQLKSESEQNAVSAVVRAAAAAVRAAAAAVREAAAAAAATAAAAVRVAACAAPCLHTPPALPSLARTPHHTNTYSRIESCAENTLYHKESHVKGMFAQDLLQKIT